MDNKRHTITLYSVQTDEVCQIIQQEGACFSKPEYIQRKYQESAKVFLTAYGWFAQAAEAIVPKPEGAEYPYWAFEDADYLEQPGINRLLTLDVPAEQGIYFDSYDWTTILQLRYLGQTPEEAQDFRKGLAARGISEYDAMMTAFYPLEKQAIQRSWHRLFRHHEQILSGDRSGVGRVQAGLWQIRREWVRRIE